MSLIFACQSITALPDWKSPSVRVRKDLFFDKKQADDWIINEYKVFIKQNKSVRKSVFKLLNTSSNLESLSNEEILRGVNEWIGSKYVNEYWLESYMDIPPFECNYTIHELPSDVNS